MTKAARMSDACTHHLTPEFRKGVDHPSFDLYAEPIDEESFAVDVGKMVELLEATMGRKWAGGHVESDAWLAPRLHSVLRLTRRQAADRLFWNWLLLTYGQEYTLWRWQRDEDKVVPVDRFVGSGDKQALHRLWLMAELFRNGSDYGPVKSAFRYQDLANNFARLDVAHHRPTALAFAAAAEKLKLSGDDFNTLSKACNAAATTLLFEVMAEHDPVRGGYDWHDCPEIEAPFEDEPTGPNNEEVPQPAIDTLVEFFEELWPLVEDLGRDRSKRSTGGSAGEVQAMESTDQ